MLGVLLMCAFAGCDKATPTQGSDRTASRQFEAYITEQQYQEIEAGMTKEEVLARLGEPSGGNSTGGFFQYYIKNEEQSDLVAFYFADGKVFQINRLAQ